MENANLQIPLPEAPPLNVGGETGPSGAGAAGRRRVLAQLSRRVPGLFRPRWQLILHQLGQLLLTAWVGTGDSKAWAYHGRL